MVSGNTKSLNYVGNDWNLQAQLGNAFGKCTQLMEHTINKNKKKCKGEVTLAKVW